jgi:hypothetical protein
MTTLQTSTLRPGLLVSLSTPVRGNARYDKVDLEQENIEEGAAKARWETTRTVADPLEFERGKKARHKAAGLIRSRCALSAFGLLCPESNADDLAAAIKEAQAVVAEFNASATLSRLHLYVITGRIAQDDVEAVRAINSEVRDLMDAMAVGVEKIDAKAIREAAAKARSIGNMLSPDAQARVQIAIEAARSAAKKIVAAGEAGAIEIDRMSMRKITEQRTAFLDMSDAVEISRPAAEARAVDLDAMFPPSPVVE